MPVGLRSTFPGYSQQPSQQQMAAVAIGLNADLGYTVPLTVTVAADSDSALLIVVGFNSFMCMIDPAVSANTYTISWVHCDPDTGAVLFARQIQAAVGTGSPTLFSFGAFGQSTAVLSGDVFHSGKLRLRAAGGNVVVNNIRLWAGKR